MLVSFMNILQHLNVKLTLIKIEIIVNLCIFALILIYKHRKRGGKDEKVSSIINYSRFLFQEPSRRNYRTKMEDCIRMVFYLQECIMSIMIMEKWRRPHKLKMALWTDSLSYIHLMAH